LVCAVGVGDADVGVFGEADDAGSCVGTSDSDLEHSALVTEDDFVADINSVAADSPVRVVAIRRCCFESGLIRNCRGGPIGE
jgi:hypothetical protein